jgi:hypothetical protein
LAAVLAAAMAVILALAQTTLTVVAVPVVILAMVDAAVTTPEHAYLDHPV